MARENGVKRDLADAVGSDRLAALGASADLSGAIGTLLARAQRAGAIRPDIDVRRPDAHPESRVQRHPRCDDRRRRLAFSVILDGLRRT
ncbi:hypothetical protein ASD42_24490 [Nocardia sp. Root136]|nr:hypothetical protein ASD42_24490 [Nocardia sp. Root136]